MLPENLNNALKDACNWLLEKNDTKLNKWGNLPNPRVAITFKKLFDWSDKWNERKTSTYTIFECSPLLAAFWKFHKETTGDSNLPIPVCFPDMAESLKISVDEALTLQYLFEDKDFADKTLDTYEELKKIAENLKKEFKK